MRWSAGFLTLLLCVPGALGQPPARKQTAFALSAPQTIDYKPGKLVVVTAEGAAKVEWEIVAPVEVDAVKQGASLVLAMPPSGTTVVVIGAAVIDGQIALARTQITVRGGKEPVPGSGTPPRAALKVRHATIVYDSQSATPALKALMNSPGLVKACADRGVKLRTVDVRDPDPAVKALGFDRLRDAGGGDCLVLQDASGNLLPNGQLFKLTPNGNLADDEAGFLQLLTEGDK